MRSDVNAVAERRFRRVVQLACARPWLSAAALLALATAALFAWFLTERWDDVGVSIPAATPGNTPNGSGRFASPPLLMEEAAAQPLEAESGPAAAYRPTAQPRDFSLFEDGSFDAAPAMHPAVQTAGAEAAAPAVLRGAWLTGTIEVITDHAPARQAACADWPGLAGDPVFR
jgi:hypothetical protein